MSDVSSRSVPVLGRALPGWAFPLGVVASVCFVLAYVQPFGVSRDYLEYDSFFDSLRSSGLSELSITRFEPGFVVSAFLLISVLANNLAVYGVLASLSLSVKAVVTAAFSRRPYALAIAFALYVARFIPIHELTQLRASMSIAALLVAFLFHWRHKRALFVLACCVAISLHMSSVFIVPFLAFSVFKRTHVLLIAVGGFFLVRIALEGLVTYLAPDLPVLALYEAAFAGGEILQTHNPWSLALLLDVGMLLSGIVLWESLSGPMRHVLLLEAVGLAFFYGAIDLPIFALRVREMCDVFWCIYVAEGVTRRPWLRALCVVYVMANIVGYVQINFFNYDDPLFR